MRLPPAKKFLWYVALRLFRSPNEAFAATQIATKTLPALPQTFFARPAEQVIFSSWNGLTTSD